MPYLRKIKGIIYPIRTGGMTLNSAHGNNKAGKYRISCVNIYVIPVNTRLSFKES